MSAIIAWAIVIYLVLLPFRLASRRRARAATPPPAVVVVVQMPGTAAGAPLTLEEELELIARDGAR